MFELRSPANYSLGLTCHTTSHLLVHERLEIRLKTKETACIQCITVKCWEVIESHEE